jgi:hypothetical protein
MTNDADLPPEAELRAFAVKDCGLIAIATGRKVLTLKELHDALENVTAASIYYHFWGGLLQPRFEEREYHNDFAAWSAYALHDAVLAERLAVIDPTVYIDLQGLRQELIAVLEARTEEDEERAWRPAMRQFELIRAQIVVFNTGRSFERPPQLAAHIPKMPTGSIFYHFIDARRRLPEGNDFSAWLSALDAGYDDLARQLIGIDPFFSSLSELRDRVTAVMAARFREEAA